MVRYAFNVGLLHPLLLAGLPGALSYIGPLWLWCPTRRLDERDEETLDWTSTVTNMRVSYIGPLVCHSPQLSWASATVSAISGYLSLM